MGDYFRPQENRVARKEHRCIACAHPIPKGDTYVVQSGYYDGKAFRHKFHPECADELHESGDDVFIAGELDPPERILKRGEG